MSARDQTHEGASASSTLGIVLWTIVILALAYGIFKAVDTALALFGA